MDDSIRNVSDDARDKLAAALSWWRGKLKNNIHYERAPLHYEACFEWHQKLSAADQELVLTLADVTASAHKGAAVGMATSLLPAPRCPL